MKCKTNKLCSNEPDLKNFRIKYVEKIPSKSEASKSIYYLLNQNKKNNRNEYITTLAFIWKSDLVHFNIRKLDDLNQINFEISLIQNYLSALEPITFVEAYPEIKDVIATHQRIAYEIVDDCEIKFSLVGSKEKYLDGVIQLSESGRIKEIADIENKLGNQIKAAIAQKQYDSGLSNGPAHTISTQHTIFKTFESPDSQENKKIKEATSFGSGTKAYSVPILTGSFLAGALVTSASLLPSSVTSLTYIAFLFAGVSVAGVTMTASAGVALGMGLLMAAGIYFYRNKNDQSTFAYTLLHKLGLTKSRSDNTAPTSSSISSTLVQA